MVFALAGVVAPTQPVQGALSVTAPTALTAADRQLLRDNPTLGALSPELLHEALALIAAARAGTIEARGILRALDELDQQLLDLNPVVQEVMRSSPEASADLLQLLKTAGSSSKPKK